MCTNFKIPAAKDGTVTVGRSLEFPTAMPMQLAVLPNNFEGKATGSDNGVTWTAKYGAVGVSAFSKPEWLTDGMNTEGLSAHLLYMPGGYAKYQDVQNDGKDISQVDVIAYLLGTCSTVAEVQEAMADKRVTGFDPGMGFPPPVHVLLHDKDASIAIEFHPGEVRIIDNPTGVGTNAPYMEWHLENLNNYGGFSAATETTTEAFGQTYKAFGQGGGFRGIPGDWTPPARFVRAFAMVTLGDQPANSQESEQFALHMLNAFDIPIGIIKEQVADGSYVDEVTVWDSIANLTELRYSYRTVTDPNVYVIDLKKTDFSAPARVKEFSWSGNFTETSI